MNIICVNGPPRSGKDTVCGMIKSQLGRITPPQTIVSEKFALPLNAIAQATTGMTDESFGIHREDKKDDPLPYYDDVTMRDLLIYISENYIKVLFGKDYFAIQAFLRLKQGTHDQIVLFSDSGFQLEYDTLKRKMNEHNMGQVKLIQLHRDGCNYDNDSREYVDDPRNTTFIQNNGSLNELAMLVDDFILHELLFEPS